ncbi:unnamed protein product [Adineta steineri]|uniref:G-protein coupled receptors family 1 profile domain-containing protein n=1 Tax=Adineta steineri TaxID=433720 RepID=A0A814JPL0_9BILA|nr:unnamed protein product [Adineta steineri]
MLPYVVDSFNGKNGTETYLWWCKLVNYSGDAGYTLLLLALCLGSIDRYHATSRNARLRQRSSMKVATISVTIITLISLLLAIPDLLYWYIDNSFGYPICIYDSTFYLIYSSYFLGVFLNMFASLSLLLIFGVLTYYNLKSVQHASVRDRTAVINVGTTAHTASMNTGIPNNNNGQSSGVYGEKRMRELAENITNHFLKQTNNNSLQFFFYFNNTDSHSPPAAIQDCRYLAQAFKDLKIMAE